MLSWLEGNVIHIEQNEIVINANSVGYLISVGDNFQRNFTKGEKASVIIYTSVKEDEIRLFGFESFESRKLFVLLLSVNGIGPKVGQKIIDQISSQQIIQAILNNDYSEFLKISGVGKKTAQRLIIDLQGKINSLEIANSNLSEDILSGSTRLSATPQVKLDTKSALSNLGYPERDIEKTINKHFQTDVTIDELIRKCLSDLNQYKN